MKNAAVGRCVARARLVSAVLAGVVVVGLLGQMGVVRQAGAQPLPPAATVKRVDPGFHALVHADLIASPGERVSDATVVVRDGVIVSVESGGAVPVGARVWDCTGLRIYPGLIEPYLPVSLPGIETRGAGAHWNESVRAERSAAREASLSAGDREARRKMGFTHAVLVPDSGVFRGTTALVSLGESDDASRPEPVVLAEDVWHAVALETGGWRSASYPGSKMGAIALVRQVLSDAVWWPLAWEAHQAEPARNPRPEANDALAALAEPRGGLLFDVGDELDALRVAKIAEEFGREFAIVGSGMEFRRLPAVLELGVPIIVPMSFPKPPAVATRADRDAVTLRDLMEWEQGPTNARRLVEAGAKVAITASKLGDGERFEANLRKAIRHGLERSAALAALTTVPAEMLGQGDRLGRVAPGYLANMIVVADGELFSEDRVIRDVWVEGKRYEVNAGPGLDLAGEWRLRDSDGVALGTLVVDGEGSVSYRRPGAAVEGDAGDDGDGAGEDEGDEAQEEAADEGEGEGEPARTGRLRRVTVVENRLDVVFPSGVLPGEEASTLSVVVRGDSFAGELAAIGGRAVRVTGQRVRDEEGDEEKEEAGDDEAEDFEMPPDILAYPLGAYGYEPDWPEFFPPNLVLVNATVWSNEERGIFDIASVIVSNGKIVSIVPGEVEAEYEPGMRDGLYVLDCRGKHITPGLIDCHSHTGISGGVNEGTRSSTAMVRIGDVIDPDDISWYRQLASGITAANQLHGSANAIGGQNSVVKLRWGAKHPDEMRIEDAPGGIKFALGENVKQSNWGDRFTTRYPQTRMGVDTFIRDRFHAAREYAARMERYDATPENERGGVVPPRRDLELEALAEVLAGDRWIHCHSYRQDEIIQLCRIAADFGFRIGTFQHVLEGYKCAEVIVEHARGASAFSDWWGYKFEVFDAIPQAGALMHDVGVNVSFNSDSDELARRMNVEAAKAVKYGGVSREEALKFVTLNPAIQLGISHRVGSIEPGKDADLVIWSGDPLSSFSRVERVFIEGVEMFSIEKDDDLRYTAERERARLLTKLLDDVAREDRGSGSGSDAARPGGSEGDAPIRVDGPEPETFISSLRAGRSASPMSYGIRPDFQGDAAAQRAYEMRTLEVYFDWMVSNGLDPFRCGPGDCGCAFHSAFQIR